MKWPGHSLRWRIQAWHGLILGLVLLGFGALAWQLADTSEARHVDTELQSRATALLGNIAHQPGRPPRPRHFGPEQEGMPDEPPPDGPPDGPPGEPPPPPNPRGFPPPGGFHLRPELAALFGPGDPESGGEDVGFYYRIWTRRGDIFGSSTNVPVDLPPPTDANEGGRARAMEFRTREGRREVMAFTPPGEIALVRISEAGRQAALARFAEWLAAIGAGVLGLGLAGGWWLAARAIAPIAEISAAAERITAGRLNERVLVTGTGSELDALAGVLNHTFERLETAFAEQARFTSDAAHELRTPVAVILAQTQLALARPRGAEEYRESLETVGRAAGRMQSLIESLLTLARLETGAEPLRIQPCDLADVAREQADLLRPLAEERGILLRAELEPAVCAADPDRVAQICVNLLSNAVKYCPMGSEVRLGCERRNGQALLRVSDDGPGIAQEHLPHLFEPFYRADASRARATGGAGLGLAICKSLAEAQGGTLEVESVEQKGSTFTLFLPTE